jgi:hypothetical protein
VKHTVTIEYDLEDIPAELAEVALRYDLCVIIKKRWESGAYRLKLRVDYEDVVWDEILGRTSTSTPTIRSRATQIMTATTTGTGLVATGTAPWPSWTSTSPPSERSTRR